MQNKPFLFKMFFLLSSLSTAAAVALRCIAVFTELDLETGYFDGAYSSIADKVLIASVVLSLIYILIGGKEERLIINLDSPLNYVFSGVLGSTLIFFAYRAMESYREYRAVIEQYKPYPYINTGTEKLLMYLSLFTAIFALLSSLYFLFSAIFIKRRDVRRADFGLVSVLFFSLYAAYLYFNQNMPINSPAKVVSQMAFLASALFFLYETRISIGRERWRAYGSFGFAAMALAAYSSVPALLIYIIKGRIISESIYETVLLFTVFLFILTRLLLTSSAKADRESSVAILIKHAASCRIEALTPEEEEESSEKEGDDEGRSDDYYELVFEAADDESPSITQSNIGE